MKILVTGADGFMMSHLVDLLDEDNKYGIRTFKGDITRKEDCIRNLRGIDTVVNGAALTYLPPSWSNPEAYTAVNYQGVVNLLQCHEMFSRFIQISTSHVYGNQTQMPIDIEVNEPHPQDPYSIAKFAAEKAVVAHADKFKFDYLVVRPFNNFGPRQSKHFVVPAFILQALKNNKILVRGNTEREFLYVKDNVRAIKWFLDDGATGFRQVCQGKPYHVADIARMICDVIDNNCRVEVAGSDRPFDIQRLWGVCSPLPDWFKFTPMEKALKETVDYYHHNA